MVRMGNIRTHGEEDVLRTQVNVRLQARLWTILRLQSALDRTPANILMERILAPAIARMPAAKRAGKPATKRAKNKPKKKRKKGRKGS